MHWDTTQHVSIQQSILLPEFFPRESGGKCFSDDSPFFVPYVRLRCLFHMSNGPGHCSLDFGDGQFSERCDVDGSFFNSDVIIFWKG